MFVCNRIVRTFAVFGYDTTPGESSLTSWPLDLLQLTVTNQKVASCAMRYYIAGYNDKYRTTSSYYVRTREKQAVRNGYCVTFYAGFYASFRGS